MWQAAPQGFDDVGATRGWDIQAIVDLQRANWPAWADMTSGPVMLGLNFEAAAAASVDLAQHNTMLAHAYAVARAARGRGSLRLLDWGGGLGHYAVLTRGLFPELRLDYHCFDQPRFCEAGRQLLPADHFYEEPAEALRASYDLVLASSSLWYERDWRARLADLAASMAPDGWLYLTRQVVVEGSESFVALQRPEAFGYPTEYLCWILNREELLGAAAASGLSLEREFLIHPGPEIVDAPAQGDYRGYLFRR